MVDNDSGMASQPATAPNPVLPFHDPSRKSRLAKVVSWFVGLALLIVVLNVLGVDARGG